MNAMSICLFFGAILFTDSFLAPRSSTAAGASVRWSHWRDHGRGVHARRPSAVDVLERLDRASLGPSHWSLPRLDPLRHGTYCPRWFNVSSRLLSSSLGMSDQPVISMALSLAGEYLCMVHTDREGIFMYSDRYVQSAAMGAGCKFLTLALDGSFCTGRSTRTCSFPRSHRSRLRSLRRASWERTTRTATSPRLPPLSPIRMATTSKKRALLRMRKTVSSFVSLQRCVVQEPVADLKRTLCHRRAPSG